MRIFVYLADKLLRFENSKRDTHQKIIRIEWTDIQPIDGEMLAYKTYNLKYR